MFPSPFEYHKPRSLQEAAELLARWPGEARLLAGGQSLIPSMKLRLSQPARLIDLAEVAELRGIRVDGSDLSIGAMTRHREVEASAVVTTHLPCLSEVAGGIADPQVRNMGTIGGSLANADPAADYPASVLALGGTLTLVSARGRRDVAADEWSLALMTTALREDEILASVRLPLLVGGEGAAYVKVPHPASRFAAVGIAAKVGVDGEGVCRRCRIAATGVGEMVQRAPRAESTLVGTRAASADIDLASSRAAEELAVMPDDLLSEDGKRQLARLTVRKALRLALRRAAPAAADRPPR